MPDFSQTPSKSLSPAVLAAMASLLGELAGSEASLEFRRRQLCAGLAEQIEADGWIWTFGVVDQERKIPINAGLLYGGISDRQAMVMLNSMSDQANPSPLNREFVALLGKGKPFTVRRRDVVSDEVWYASENTKAYRLREGIDDLLYSLLPSKGGFSGMAFLRKVEREGFSARHRDMVAFALGSAWRLCSVESGEMLSVDAMALSPRLRSVLTLLLEGYLCKEIAECYSLSPHTVKGYIRDIYRHFSVHSQLTLIRHFRGKM
ncbi:MAG: helix-turn-helix transcriptional regulator [Phycisphaerales bacterium]|jgi:DNA-binding CsgD family transcriptional regulator|nr:helix-turn-helix transcriptional regulator [Phycisphaerales bacterium]MBT7170667.1 helix-turn-helix transcriptional regulator [Phycisphaerales bacterium]